MSPLVRSLLALAALLAAADAQYNCVTVVIGQKTDYTKDLDPLDIPNGAELNVPDLCPYPLHLVGEKITVCKKTPNTDVAELSVMAGTLTPVFIKCEDSAGCEVSTTEYCG